MTRKNIRSTVALLLLVLIRASASLGQSYTNTSCLSPAEIQTLNADNEKTLAGFGGFDFLAKAEEYRQLVILWTQQSDDLVKCVDGNRGLGALMPSSCASERTKEEITKQRMDFIAQIFELRSRLIMMNRKLFQPCP